MAGEGRIEKNEVVRAARKGEEREGAVGKGDMENAAKKAEEGKGRERSSKEKMKRKDGRKDDQVKEKLEASIMRGVAMVLNFVSLVLQSVVGQSPLHPGQTTNMASGSPQITCLNFPRYPSTHELGCGRVVSV